MDGTRYWVSDNMYLIRQLSSVFKDAPSRSTIKATLAVVSRARKTVRVLTTATIAQIPAVSSKEGAVFGAVLCMRKFHRGHH
jgi:hypothetical protein